MKWSKHTSYATPQYLRDALETEFGFDLDPCPLNPDFDPAVHQDGLKLDWHGHRVFCNPPWDTIMPWVEKAFASKALTVFLLPARTDTAWFHLLKDSGAEIRLFRKRVHFLRDGIGGNKAPTDGTMVAVVRHMNAQDADLPKTEMPQFGASEQFVSSRTSLDGMFPLTRAESDVIALVNFAATQ
jgi:hypothetical protein